MKDLYSFHTDKESHNKFYEIVAEAYLRVFSRMSLEAYRIKASGGIFSGGFSDEFQVVCETGEDEVLANKETRTGYNTEVEDRIPVSERAGLERLRTIEIGNIFHLGSKYTDAFGVNYLDKDGKIQPVIMGSYGIGITRLLGTLAEIYNDERGLILPATVAPFQIHLIDMTGSERGEVLYKELTDNGFEVLFDDRETGIGEKLVDADLIGLPIRLIHSPKTAATESVELKFRNNADVELIKLSGLIDRLQKP
jgi:prolyl-tRNA synthetase